MQEYWRISYSPLKIRPLLILALVGLCSARLVAVNSSHSLHSPNGAIVADVRVSDRICFDLTVADMMILKDSTLSLRIDDETLGLSPQLRSAETRSHDDVLPPVVRQKAAELRDHYNELRLEMEGGYAVVFRAYDEGVAYRWETSLPAEEVKVFSEEVTVNFADDFPVRYPAEESFFSHQEPKFEPKLLGELKANNLASLPAVVDAHGIKIAIAESDVVDYPGLWLRGAEGNGIRAVFPPYPLEEEIENDQTVRVSKEADYIAITSGTRTYPWRILGVARNDGELITNALVYLLASPTSLTDTTWIKPGKVAWDWWNAWNIGGVDFKAGINTATYKHYIDFAAEQGIEYIIIDAGWYVRGDLLKVSPDMDMKVITDYAKQQNVGVILWVAWKTLDEQMTPALEKFAEWGVKGLKVDYMQRDDQPVMQFYESVCREAAKYQMLVDFHGSQRPALMTRTWPNLITTEGVRGNEWNKWSADITPEHTVTLPFTRMFLGPMDFTPGAMLHATEKGFSQNNTRPMSQGTRCNQLAMYVIYESPLQMLCDSPTNYRREPESLKFISAVPTVWDESRVLAAKMGDYVVMARRSGSAWFCGAMTDWTARELAVDLSFLPEGEFTLEEWSDGVNADRLADDYCKTMRPVTNETKLTLKLAPGGGWAARIRKK